MKSIVSSVRASCALGAVVFVLSSPVSGHAQDAPGGSPLDDLDQGPDQGQDAQPAESAPAPEQPADESAAAPEGGGAEEAPVVAPPEPGEPGPEPAAAPPAASGDE